MGKQIGIMGGTFNPIHYGHLLLAESARETFHLDKIVFIPSGIPYMKDSSSILNGESRLHMVMLAIEGNPYFELSRIELDRTGPTYTRDTLASLQMDNNEDKYYFIMGADSLLMIESWKDPKFIMQNCTILAAVRGNETAGNIEKKAEYLIRKYQADIRILPSRYIDISSSDIRNNVKQGTSVRYMLPDKVAEYIQKNGLYLSLS